jgi:hypothetical protein
MKYLYPVSTQAFCALENQYVYWPDGEGRQQIMNETETELPGCIGWIDGTDVKLAEAPIVDRDSFYDKNKAKHF